MKKLHCFKTPGIRLDTLFGVRLDTLLEMYSEIKIRWGLVRDATKPGGGLFIGNLHDMHGSV